MKSQLKNRQNISLQIEHQKELKISIKISRKDLYAFRDNLQLRRLHIRGTDAAFPTLTMIFSNHRNLKSLKAYFDSS